MKKISVQTKNQKLYLFDGMDCSFIYKPSMLLWLKICQNEKQKVK